MTGNNYFQVFKTAIARIYNTNGAVVGAGFFVSDRHLLTCAHVVAVALTIPENTQELPQIPITVDFPLVAPGQKVQSKIVFWQPVNSSNFLEDIAGLELENIPINIQPVQLSIAQDFFNHKFRIFGFPSGLPNGIWTDGVLKDTLANGRVQMQGNSAQGHRIERGFSGTPVWDEELNAVVGMTVEAERDEQKKVGFMMPTQVLFSAWPELPQLNSAGVMNSPRTHQVKELNLAQRLKKETLEKRLARLEKDYQGLERDYEAAGYSDEKNRLQFKLDGKLEEIQQIQDELDKFNDGK